MSQINALQVTLPNFPTDVIEEWLLPYAKLEGWPPARDFDELPKGSWRYLLKNRPLTYWRSLSWSKVERHVSIHDLSPEWQSMMVQMMLGAVKGQPNLYSVSIKDLAPRFNRILEYFERYGVFPKPPALLIEQQQLTVLDGNHRLAAYLYCYGYFIIDGGAALKEITKESQTYWVGLEP